MDYAGRARADREAKEGATSWGREVPLIGAPLHGDLAIAGTRFPQPMTFHHGPVEGRPDFFDSSSYAVRAYFGNALFFERFVVVMDVPRSRFGLWDVTAREK